MTEELNTQPQGAANPLQEDWFLQMLVSLVNSQEGLEFGITISVGGGLVSGTLTSGRNYFETFGEQFGAGWEKSLGAESAKTVREALQANGRMYDDKNAPSPSLTTYIHLRDARHFYPGGAVIPNEGVCWRGRLQSVDGFTLGNLSVGRSVKP